MPPVPPNGESALSVNETERPGGAGDRSAEVPRRVLAKDGLHVGERGRVVETRERPSEPPPPEDRSLMALVSSARHELRAPLQSIQGFAELLATEAYGLEAQHAEGIQPPPALLAAAPALSRVTL